MILVDNDIRSSIESKMICIEPFNPECIRVNSYDLHLSSHMATYKEELLDAKIDNPVNRFEIPESGYILMPGVLYLGSTLERTESHLHVPFIEGKSSVGRLGISIHVTAGVGDVGFCGHWTLEITVVQPVRIYSGMPIAQIIWHKATGYPKNPYNIIGSNYCQQGELPVPSKMWKSFIK